MPAKKRTFTRGRIGQPVGMMATSDYPLRALMELRERVQQQRELAHVAAGEALELAESQLRSHRAEWTAKKEQLARRRAGIPSTGRCGAERLAQEQRFIARSTADTRAAEQRMQQANDRVQEARRRLERCREELAVARADVVTLEKNKESWDMARLRAAERRAEQELEELINSRR